MFDSQENTPVHVTPRALTYSHRLRALERKLRGLTAGVIILSVLQLLSVVLWLCK